MLGYACLTARHLLDPAVIVLGGGVIEACSDFIMPIVENIVGSDRLPGARDGGQVLLSALGDDAVVLGAVALVRKLAGRSPFKKQFAITPSYPEIVRAAHGEITVSRKTYQRDVYISVSGKVKKRGKALSKEHDVPAHAIRPKELRKVCRGGPEILFVGAGKDGKVELTEEARRYLSQRAIRCEILPTAEAVEAYNGSKQSQGGVNARDGVRDGGFDSTVFSDRSKEGKWLEVGSRRRASGDVLMPEISRFFGVLISMYYHDHSPPHFHVRYGSQKALISIDRLTILEGRLSPRVLGLVIEWAALHRTELEQDWERSRQDLPLERIDPLE